MPSASDVIDTLLALFGGYDKVHPTAQSRFTRTPIFQEPLKKAPSAGPGQIVRGYYDFDKKHIVTYLDLASPQGQSTLSHEIIHALLPGEPEQRAITNQLPKEVLDYMIKSVKRSSPVYSDDLAKHEIIPRLFTGDPATIGMSKGTREMYRRKIMEHLWQTNPRIARTLQSLSLEGNIQ